MSRTKIACEGCLIHDKCDWSWKDSDIMIHVGCIYRVYGSSEDDVKHV